jgi:hypothetical protein
MNARRSGSVKGREARVDICPLEAGFVLSVGRTSLWLEPETAEDLVETLERALLAARAGGGPAGPRAAARALARRTHLA